MCAEPVCPSRHAQCRAKLRSRSRTPTLAKEIAAETADPSLGCRRGPHMSDDTPGGGHHDLPQSLLTNSARTGSPRTASAAGSAAPGRSLRLRRRIGLCYAQATRCTGDRAAACCIHSDPLVAPPSGPLRPDIVISSEAKRVVRRGLWWHPLAVRLPAGPRGRGRRGDGFQGRSVIPPEQLLGRLVMLAKSSVNSSDGPGVGRMMTTGTMPCVAGTPDNG